LDLVIREHGNGFTVREEQPWPAASRLQAAVEFLDSDLLQTPLRRANAAVGSGSIRDRPVV
jgi:hypothetical protein